MKKISELYSKNIMELNTKAVIIILRWMSILLLLCFVLFSDSLIKAGYSFIIVMAVYGCSNIVFSFINKKMFQKTNFNYAMLIADTVLVSLGIYFSLGFKSDVFLVYFMVIFMAILRQDINGSFVIGLISALLYLGLFIKTTGFNAFFNTEELLRIPFFFLVSLIGTYVSQVAHFEKEKMRQHLVQLEKTSYLGESIAGIIHQLKSPINTIAASGQMLLEVDDIAVIKTKAKKIVEKAFESAALINKYLDFVRTKQVTRVRMDVNLLIDNILLLFQDEYRIQEIDIVKKYDSSLPRIDASPDLLQQVFLNLIHNAKQAIIKNGIAGTITVQTKSLPGIIKISITDTGPGIEDEILDRIFEPFFTTKEEGVGTGLGLSIAKDIIDKHNGKIYAYSRKEGGATFVIELPA